MTQDSLYSIENLYNPNYDCLSIDEKQQLLRVLGKKYGFKLVEFKLFERFELSSYTAVFEKDEGKFVFVPGAEVTLGWEGFRDENGNLLKDKRKIKDELTFDMFTDYDYLFGLMDKNYQSERNYYEEVDGVDVPTLGMRMRMNDPVFLEKVEQEIKSHTSKIEQVKINPMFVEMNVNRCDWSEFMKHDKELFQKFKNMIDVRFLNKENNEEVSFKELRNALENKGYRIPSKREWEYLASKGTPTLHSWGNCIDDSIKVEYFYEEGIDYRYDLREPNFFGVVIASFPYELEITFDGMILHKGGDGGGFLCGGMGKDLGYLPISSYYEYSKGKLPEERVTRGSFRRVFEIKGW